MSHVSSVRCQESCCHTSHVTCYMSRVNCHMSLLPKDTAINTPPANSHTMHNNKKNISEPKGIFFQGLQ